MRKTISILSQEGRIVILLISAGEGSLAGPAPQVESMNH